MAKNFEDLVGRAQAGWSTDTRRVYEAASSEFAAEIEERAELGARLTAARTAHSLTQSALAEMANIQQAEISRIERGVGNPTVTTLLRLTTALGQKLTLMPAT